MRGCNIMPRGKGRGHKGKSRHYTTEAEVEEGLEKARRQKEWQRKKGLLEESDEEKGDEKKEKKLEKGKGDESESESESESSEESSDGDEARGRKAKKKGIESLIEIENPNRVLDQKKKATDIDINAKVALSRRERETVERERSEAHYRKMHMEGKTEEARSDLARLALVRKQREEAAKKREEEKKKKEEGEKARVEEEKKRKEAAGHRSRRK